MVIETLGTVALFTAFRKTVGGGALFYALFHAVSAFCNAGFSLFSENLEGYTRHGLVNGTVIVLVVLGGLGFVVLQDLVARLRRRGNSASG